MEQILGSGTDHQMKHILYRNVRLEVTHWGTNPKNEKERGKHCLLTTLSQSASLQRHLQKLFKVAITNSNTSMAAAIVWFAVNIGGKGQWVPCPQWSDLSAGKCHSASFNFISV